MLYFPPKELLILTNYSDSPKTNMLLFYDLGEIVAEKMRALMERTTPRDLYDLWYMLEVEGLDIEDYASAFQGKAVFKGLSPSLFVEMVWVKRNLLKRQWDFSLAHQMHDLPGFDEVWRDFGKHLRRFNKFIYGSKAEEEEFEYGVIEES
jgi:predicted nucleotidyltransferase component of viral defense system